MLEDSQELAQAIEDGTYFAEGRKWYSTVYMSIISERYFFIVLTTVAGLTGIIALIAVALLMPLNPRAPFLYQARNAYEQIPLIDPIKTYRSQDINDAMRRFYVTQYIIRREGYSSTTVDRRLNFVRNHSEPDAYERYARYLDATNPQSPLVKLGIFYVKRSEVESSAIQIVPDTARSPSGAPVYVATVPFTVGLYGQKLEQEVNYRAIITFSYKDLVVKQTESVTDEPFDVTPMVFKVMDYRVGKASKSDSRGE